METYSDLSRACSVSFGHLLSIDTCYSIHWFWPRTAKSQISIRAVWCGPSQTAHAPKAHFCLARFGLNVHIPKKDQKSWKHAHKPADKPSLSLYILENLAGPTKCQILFSVKIKISLHLICGLSLQSAGALDICEKEHVVYDSCMHRLAAVSSDKLFLTILFDTSTKIKPKQYRAYKGWSLSERKVSSDSTGTYYNFYAVIV